MKQTIDWKYGENKYQRYYDATIGKDYLCVFCCEWSPDLWTGMVNNIMIHNKTKNDRQRKKQGLPKSAHCSELQIDYLLAGQPEYMMKKVEYCYKHNLNEISE